MPIKRSRLRKPRLIKRLHKSRFILLPLLLLMFVVGITFIKTLSNDNKQYLYIKIKVGPGYWWASNAKPGIWLSDSIKKGDFENNVLGNNITLIERVTHYPTNNSNEIFESRQNTYVTAKILTKYQSSTQQHIFKRFPISVGSPIEINLNTTSLTGTIMEVSREPIFDELVTKRITLIKRQGFFIDDPYEYNSIDIGDSYFNGEQEVFKVTDKSLKETTRVVSDINARLHIRNNQVVQHIILEADMKVRVSGDKLIFGEEHNVQIGEEIPLETSRSSLPFFSIINIEDTHQE